MAAESELSARGDSDLSDSLVQVEQLRERARGLANVITERRRAMERDRGQLMDAGVVANLEAEGARLEAELGDVVEGLGALAPEADEGPRRRELPRERAETGAVIEAATGGGSAAASAAAEVRGEMRSMRTGVERAEMEPTGRGPARAGRGQERPVGGRDRPVEGRM